MHVVCRLNQQLVNATLIMNLHSDFLTPWVGALIKIYFTERIYIRSLEIGYFHEKYFHEIVYLYYIGNPHGTLQSL